MKKLLGLLCLLVFLSMTTITQTSCNRKAHCPAYGKTGGPDTDKNGNYKANRKKSSKLFPKGM